MFKHNQTSLIKSLWTQKEKRICNLVSGKMLKIVTLHATKAVVVTKCSNIKFLLPLLNFAVYASVLLKLHALFSFGVYKPLFDIA